MRWRARTTVALLVPLAVPSSCALAKSSCSGSAPTRYWATARSEVESSSQASRTAARSRVRPVPSPTDSSGISITTLDFRETGITLLDNTFQETHLLKSTLQHHASRHRVLRRERHGTAHPSGHRDLRFAGRARPPVRRGGARPHPRRDRVLRSGLRRLQRADLAAGHRPRRPLAGAGPRLRTPPGRGDAGHRRRRGRRPARHPRPQRPRRGHLRQVLRQDQRGGAWRTTRSPPRAAPPSPPTGRPAATAMSTPGRTGTGGPASPTPSC